MAGVPVRVLIADDQQLMVARTAAALDARDRFELIGVAADTAVAAELAGAKRAGVCAVMREDQLDIVFQPIVALDSRAIVGYEALARFSAHPRRGPDRWFQEAHEVGIGAELELCAVRRACERSYALPQGTFMAVNVSPATAERPDLLALLAGAQVDHVVLEVTEHARVDDYTRFRVAIARVRELGARLAVDDAGAGFASLRHILELDAELIQLVELRRLGVHYGQGYHLGHPAPLPVAA